MNQHDYYISESNYTSYDNNSKNKFKYYIIKKNPANTKAKFKSPNDMNEL